LCQGRVFKFGVRAAEVYPRHEATEMVENSANFEVCKASRKFDAVMDTLGLTPQFISTSRTYMVLALTLHLLTCFWFLWKALGMTLEEMNASLDSEMWVDTPDTSCIQLKVKSKLMS
jgi:hypothetical protein